MGQDLWVAAAGATEVHFYLQIGAERAYKARGWRVRVDVGARFGREAARAQGDQQGQNLGERGHDVLYQRLEIVVQVAMAGAVGQADKPVWIGRQAECSAEQVVLGDKPLEEGAMRD